MKLTNELLQKFCSTDPYMRWLAMPRKHHGFTYATNGHLIVRVDAALFRGMPETETDRAERHSLENMDRVLNPAKSAAACVRVKHVKRANAIVWYAPSCEPHYQVNHGLARIALPYWNLIAKLPRAFIEWPTDPHNGIAFRFDGGIGTIMPVKV